MRVFTPMEVAVSAQSKYLGLLVAALQIATAGTVHFFGPFLYRTEFHSTTEAEECERWAHLTRTIEAEGPDTVAAIILETIPGDGRHLRTAAGLPGRRPCAVRPVRHRDDPGRGDGRLRPRRRLAGARPVRRRT